MKFVWASEQPLTVRQVCDRLNEGRGRPLAYNTIQTMLNILKNKGVVRCRPGEGRAFEYTARLTRDEVSTSMFDDLVERFYDGRVQPVLLSLVSDESLSRAELERLKRLIEERLDDQEPAP